MYFILLEHNIFMRSHSEFEHIVKNPLLQGHKKKISDEWMH